MKKQTKKKLLKFILVIVIAICAYFYEEYFTEEELGPTIEYREEEPVKLDSNNLQIHYVDVGQGDCILISQNNEYMLIDAGNNEDGELLVNYFKDLGIKKFKYVIGTQIFEIINK